VRSREAKARIGAGAELGDDYMNYDDKVLNYFLLFFFTTYNRDLTVHNCLLWIIPKQWLRKEAAN